MKRSTAAMVAVAALALAGIPVAAGAVLAADEPATCAIPVAEDAGGSVKFTTVCTVPKPVASTQTVTATATVTQTVPGPTVTATATVTATVTAPTSSATPTATPTVTPTPVPVAVPLMGMSTDDWDARIAETGPVASHRIFQPTWDIAALIRKIEADHTKGVTSYWSIKFNTTWAAAASGTDDARFRELGAALARLPYPTYGSFHHEPRDSNITTPTQLVPWTQANIRAMNIVGPLAGTRHMLGTTDNGFPWSNKWGKLTDAQLATYYTPALLAATDFLGGDFYDGATNSNVGEPAAVKLANFEAWAARVAPGKPLGVGEWNAVTATDIHAGWTVLRQGGWVIACIFNSGANNRDDLPSSLGGSWVLRGDRLAAFRSVLDQATIPGR